jgi:hypothetical protein
MVDAATAHSAPSANSTRSSTATTTANKDDESLPAGDAQNELGKQNYIALDTGSCKTHITILRIKHELERENLKVL